MTKSEHQKRLREKRAADGLCKSCGRDPVPGKRQCELCLKRQRDRYHNVIKKRPRDPSKCVYCKETAVDGLTMCERHRRMYCRYKARRVEKETGRIVKPRRWGAALQRVPDNDPNIYTTDAKEKELCVVCRTMFHCICADCGSKLCGTIECAEEHEQIAKEGRYAENR